jgi:hypothetical protein
MILNCLLMVVDCFYQEYLHFRFVLFVWLPLVEPLGMAEQAV